MTTDFTFPQDGDNDYSENFGTWLARSNVSDYVEEGMSVTISDPAAPEIQITTGRAFVYVEGPDSLTTTAGGDNRLSIDVVVIKPNTTFTNLSDGQVNHLYLDPNVGSNDSPKYEAETDTSNAGAQWLKIAKVDLDADTVTEVNREPDVSFAGASFSENLGIPVYSDTSNAPSGEGNLIFIDGAGTQDVGLYLHDGTSYSKTGIDSITELSDVTGVTGFEEGDDNARPTPSNAGEGYIYFNSQSQEIDYSSGSSWLTIGLGSGSINTGDLAFDTATQNELNTHAGNNNAHHTRPNAGTYIQEDANNDFNVLIAGSLENASGNIAVDESYDFTFTSNIDFSSGLNAEGDIVDNSVGLTIYNSGNGYINQGALQNDSIGITAGDGLSGGGTPSLGGSTTLTVDALDLAGSGLTVASQSNDLSLANDSITINTGTDITGGSTVSLGGSISIDHADTSSQGNVSAGAGAAITDVNVDGRGHVTGMSTTDFDSRFVIESGDTITGQINMEGEFNADNASGGRVVLPVGTDKYAT